MKDFKKALLKNNMNSSKELTKLVNKPRTNTFHQKTGSIKQTNTLSSLTPTKNESSLLINKSGKKFSETSKQIKDYLEDKSSINNGLNQTESLIPELKTSQIKVVARFRPINFVEEALSKKSEGKICVNFLSKSSCSVSTSTSTTDFSLDSIFNFETKQDDFYKTVIEASINDVLNGYNGTIFTYGQSGSGKTFTMFGNDIWNEENKGVIPRAIDQIFNFINEDKNDSKFELNFSIIEIYKENLIDLLNPDTKSTNLKIKEDPRKGIYVDNITSAMIGDKNEFFILIEEAQDNRSIAETKLNKESSRSHIVFCLSIKQILQDGSVKTGTLNLVDLAGSEKVSKTGAIGGTLEEAKKINFSLSCLGNVINCLTSGNTEFIPYRESKLTRLLKDSLGGNFKTTLIVNCSPHSYNVDETISTLNFAKRAKNVKNKIMINVKKTPEEYERIIANLQEKLRIQMMKHDKSNYLSTSLPRDMLNSIMIAKSNESTEQELSTNHRNCEETIKAKNEEVSNLKEEVENLKNDIKSLNSEIKALKNQINLDQTISHLEESLKRNLSNLEFLPSSNKTITRELLLKDSILKDCGILEERIGVNFNLQNKKSKLDENFEKVLKDLRNEIGEDPIIQKYENTHSHSKLFFNELMSDYLKKNDILKTNKQLDNEEKISVCKSEYNNLKNSYLQINALTIYYEKLLNDILENLSVDFKKILKYSDKNSKYQNLSIQFKQYIDVLDEIKKMKFNSSPNENHKTISFFNDDANINDQKNKKFVKQIVGRRSSFLISGKDLITNIITSKLHDNVGKSTPKRQTTIIDECLSFRAKENIDSKESKRSRNQPDDIANRDKTSNLSFSKLDKSDAEDTPKNEPSKDILSNNFQARKTSIFKINNFFNAVKKTNPNSILVYCNLKKKSDVNCQSGSSFTNNDFQTENRLLKKEKTLHTSFIINLTNENLEIRNLLKDYEKMSRESFDNFKYFFKKELENIKLNATILKNFYIEEINYSKGIIKKLSTTIDDMLLNKSLVLDNKLNKSLINDLYCEQKVNIMRNSINSRNLNQLAEAMINESGTASKKLDFLLFELNERKQNQDKIKIIYGSGINKQFPSKCPMYMNLKYCPTGDSGSDMVSPDLD